jgi:hypothetical protein
MARTWRIPASTKTVVVTPNALTRELGDATWPEGAGPAGRSTSVSPTSDMPFSSSMTRKWATRRWGPRGAIRLPHSPAPAGGFSTVFAAAR